MGRELDDAVILGLIKNSGGGGGTYHLPTASTAVKGGIKIDGNDFEMDGDKLKLKQSQQPYILPTASASTKGGIKVGEGLEMDGEVLNATGGGYTLPTASTETKGGIKIGAGLAVDGEVAKVVYENISDKPTLGDLAAKDSASGNYTPEGTVTPSVTGMQTATVNSITSVGVLPTVSYSDGGIVFNAGTLPTKGADQTVVSDIGTVSATFSGTAKAVTVS